MGQVMTDDVGNRVGFARARGALNDNAVIVRELLDDGDLLVVVGHREIQFEGGWRAVAGRQATEWLLRTNSNGVVTALNEAANDVRQFRGFLDRLLQAPDVLKEDVARTFATE